MIQNERQYRISKSQAEKFQRALDQLTPAVVANPELIELHRSAITSQLEELNTEISDYEALKSGAVTEIVADSFVELPQALIRARIASGLSQKQLATKLGLKEQQIQKYESTNFSGASLARLMEIVETLGVVVNNTFFLPSKINTLKGLVDRLCTLHISKELLFQTILPPSLIERLSGDNCEAELRQAASLIARVFSLEEFELLGNSTPTLRTDTAGLARFKLPSSTAQRHLKAYCVYVHYVAQLVLNATPAIPQLPVPTDASTFRSEVLSMYGDITFKSVLGFAWHLGVPVIPLSDTGQFHGAFWRIGGRNIIVLKQRTSSESRWTFDLLHELYHAAQEPTAKERAVLEVERILEGGSDTEEELGANVFAGEVLLDGRAEQLVAACVEEAGGRVERLSKVVPKVALRSKVATGALANYLAFRLTLQDINWWGAATNLQDDDHPGSIARDFLIAHIQYDAMDEADRNLLSRALTDKGLE